jgi:hypothetical protein
MDKRAQPRGRSLTAASPLVPCWVAEAERRMKGREGCPNREEGFRR